MGNSGKGQKLAELTGVNVAKNYTGLKISQLVSIIFWECMSSMMSLFMFV